jgi:hypothetical protein
MWKHLIKRSLERSRRRWEVNIEMNVTEIGREDVSWLELTLGLFQVLVLAGANFRILLPES